MKVKTRLYLNSMVFIALVSVLVFIIFLTSIEISQANKRRIASRNVLQTVSELDILAHDYSVYHAKRIQEQWRIRYASLKPLIAAAAAAEEEEEEEEEEKVLASRLSANSKRMGSFFLEALTSYEKRQQLIQEGASQDKINLVDGLEEKLIAQLFTVSQSLVSDASRLAEKNATDMLKVQDLARNLTLSIVLILLAVSLITAFTLNRNISSSLHKLHKGTEIVGSGNLDYKVGTNETDEIGQLSRAFDRMTENLKKKDLDLRDRIGELERFHDATVERELRIKELRDKIKELER